MMRILVIVILSLLSIGPTQAGSNKKSCPKKFVKVEGRCYYFSPYVLNNWYEAWRACSGMGSNLLVLETKEEWFDIQHYLADKKMHNNDWWLGGTDSLKEGEWLTPGKMKKIQFLPWCKGEPNGGRYENCLHMANYNGGWCFNDLPCENPATVFHTKFICER